MATASISELKTNLSRYLREVRRGGEVQVLDRGQPIARLTPIRASAAGESDRRDRLVRSGILRPGKGDPIGALADRPLERPASWRHWKKSAQVRDWLLEVPEIITAEPRR